MKKAVFFDRDGTLIEEKNYIKEPTDVFLLERVVETVTELKKRGYLVVVVSNQSGIARGYLCDYDFHRVNHRMFELLGNCSVIDKVYHCPHHPDFTGECNCRKPIPGMILEAAKDLNINLNESYIVGDKLSDVQLVDTAGLKGGFLVKTGYGKKFDIKNCLNVYSVEKVSEILDFIL